MNTEHFLSSLKYVKDIGRFELKRLIRREPATSTPESTELCKEIQRRGYAIVPNYYSSEKCAQLRSEVDRVIEKNQSSGYLWVDAYKADHRVFGAEVDSALVNEFYRDTYLHQIAETYFGGRIFNSNTLAGRIEAKSGNIGSGQGWHRDGNFFQFKALVYLSDVSLENGPFQMIEKSHQRLRVIKDTSSMQVLTEETRFTNEQVDKLVSKYPSRLKSFTAQEGTLIFADVSAIHRGMPIKKGNRYALFNYYYPSFDDFAARRKQFNAKPDAKSLSPLYIS